MKLFPSIKFVDEIPKEIAQKFNLKAGQFLGGVYKHSTKQIYVLKWEKKWHTLFHELGHWLIYVSTGNSFLHKWFDKHFRTKV